MSAAGEATLPVRVYYEDTDAGGIVYHAAFIRFAERGRTEFVRALGVDQQQLRTETGLGFAVSRLTIDYLKPALLDDLLTVRTRIEKTRRVSADFVQLIERGDALVARLDVRVACLDARGRPARLPTALAEAPQIPRTP